MCWMTLIPLALLALLPVQEFCRQHIALATGALFGWAVGIAVGEFMLHGMGLPWWVAAWNPLAGAYVFGEAAQNAHRNLTK